jgi:hypothetical protein
METLKSILIDLDNRKITKHQAYSLILVLFDVSNCATQVKSSGDFRDDDNRESQSEYYGK